MMLNDKFCNFYLLFPIYKAYHLMSYLLKFSGLALFNTLRKSPVLALIL
jgi:hypothetical protein